MNVELNTDHFINLINNVTTYLSDLVVKLDTHVHHFLNLINNVTTYLSDLV